MFCLSRLVSGSSCGTLRGRFVPPWERAGVKSAEEFFGAVFQSTNPGARHKREEQRRREALHQMEEASAQEETDTLRAAEAVIDGKIAERDEEEEARNFLPYGATPKYYDPSGSAAWGVYQAGIQAGSLASGDGAPYGSTVARQLLANDMESLLPYRWADGLPNKEDSELWPLHGSCGLVLDIDGVIHRSNQVIRGSDDAIRELERLKIPFVFMTNGGGHSEAKRAEKLSKMLGADIREDQIILAHSPMKLLVDRFKDQNVLVIGNPECATVARQYGFSAVSSPEFQERYPELVPLKKFHGVRPKSSGAPYPPFAAVFAFHDTVDAMSDIQILTDVLTAPFGQIGPHVSAEQTVPFYHCADDLLYASEALLPRLGGGAFREMAAAVYRSVTGRDLQVIQYGKPRAIAYQYAQRQLRKVSQRLGWNPDALRTICMVGDNLETDIVGANAAGAPWLSVHVMSGIGRAPTAVRTLSPGDEELVWLSEKVPQTPHYVAPTLDHFVREMQHFGEERITMNRPASFLANPADLRGVYNFDVFSDA